MAGSSDGVAAAADVAGRPSLGDVQTAGLGAAERLAR